MRSEWGVGEVHFLLLYQNKPLLKAASKDIRLFGNWAISSLESSLWHPTLQEPQAPWRLALQGKCPQWGPGVNYLRVSVGTVHSGCRCFATAPRRQHMSSPSSCFHSCPLLLPPPRPLPFSSFLTKHPNVQGSSLHRRH